ncbi:MAG: DoxX family protein, partial [Bacteriovorax sp.]
MKKFLKKLDWLFPLIARLSVGVVFLQSGWGKIHHIEKVTAFFTELAIPLPMIQAYFVSTVELVGGALLILGLLTRLTVVPLIVIMVVAILTAKKGEINAYTDVLGLSEYLYIVLMGWMGIGGA